MKHQLQTIRENAEFMCHPAQPPYMRESGAAILTALSELERMAGGPWIQWPGGAYPPIDDDAVFEYFTMNGEHHGPTSSASRLDWKDDYRLSDIIAYRLCTPPAQQQYEAGDMASAAAQGFRDGVASVTQQPQAEVARWCPDVCPITGKPFFMWIEHPQHGDVPTYGGPYDSYTIPVRHEDGSFCCERYDHDNGWWVTDEVHDVGVQIVSDQAYVSDEAPQQAEAVPSDVVRMDWIAMHGSFGVDSVTGLPGGNGQKRIAATRAAIDAAMAQGEKP